MQDTAFDADYQAALGVFEKFTTADLKGGF